MTLPEVAALRHALWFECGYRVLPVLSSDDPSRAKAGKAPIHKDWQLQARRNPPMAAVTPAQRHLANTGILCDRLRCIDVDIDTSAIAEAIEELIIGTLGPAPTRRRSNSRRFCALYAAAEGEPGKRALTGELGRIEVLGAGQQFVAYGRHASGAELVWPMIGPLDLPACHLPRISEAQITTLLLESARVIGAAVQEARVSCRKADAECAHADLAELTSALAAIPTEGMGYSNWIRLGAALWHATEGSADGLALWDQWSARSGFYNAAGLKRRWASFGAGSVTSKASARTVFWLARRFGWRPPALEPDAGWLAARPPVGAPALERAA